MMITQEYTKDSNYNNNYKDLYENSPPHSYNNNVTEE